MSVNFFGFYFSANADGSANDFTVYVEGDGNTVKIAPRYKSSEPNGLYQIELDESDLRLFGQMCLNLADNMKAYNASLEED